MISIRTTAAFAAGIVFVGLACQPAPPKVDITALENDIMAIVPSSEMTKAEAAKIFQLYLKMDGVRATGLNEIKDEGEYWTVDPKLAFKFKESGNNLMRIQKATGAVTWADGPSFNTLTILVGASRSQIREPGK